MHARECVAGVLLQVLSPDCAEVAALTGEVEADVGDFGGCVLGHEGVVLAGDLAEELSVLADLDERPLGDVLLVRPLRVVAHNQPGREQLRDEVEGREGHQVEVKQGQQLGLNAAQLVVAQPELASDLQILDQGNLHIELLELRCQQHAPVGDQVVGVNSDVAGVAAEEAENAVEQADGQVQG